MKALEPQGLPLLPHAQSWASSESPSKLEAMVLRAETSCQSTKPRGWTSVCKGVLP